MGTPLHSTRQRLLQRGAAWLCCLLVAACASRVEIDDKVARLDQRSLALMTISFRNTHSPGNSVLPITVVVGKGLRQPGVEGDLTRHNTLASTAYVRTLNEEGNRYLLVMENEPGTYHLHALRGNVVGGFLRPLFEAPMLLDFEVRRGEITYLGNVYLTLRTRTSDVDIRGGPITPLIDQAGFGDATFDVEIRNELEADIAAYNRRFPVLKGRPVESRVLAPWKRPTPDEFSPKGTHFLFF